jgi:hypothetical protein
MVPDLKCFAFSCPNCCDASTSESLRDLVVTIVCRDDFVSRLSPASVKGIVRNLSNYKSRAMSYLQSDWDDILKRVSELWPPRRRVEPDPFHDDDDHTIACGFTLADIAETTEQRECGEESHNVAEIWLPGRVFHIFSHRGRYDASEVPRDYPGLRKIVVQANMLQDHFAKNVLNALLEVRSRRLSSSVPPQWTPYTASAKCQVCRNDFTWHTTLSGEPSQCRERHNCRQCGKLVCSPCTVKRSLHGFISPVRTCIVCQLS